MEGHKSSPRAAEQAACAKGARHGENSKGNCVLEGGDIEIIASDVEEDLGEGKLKWFEKIWELPSEKQRFSIRSWKFLEKRKKKKSEKWKSWRQEWLLSMELLLPLVISDKSCFVFSDHNSCEN